MIDRVTRDKIIDAAQIVDVVGDFVTLKRAGANYKGLCPFHDDRTPSFMVSPAKNYCKCFACGKGGNPVSFIMEHEQMSYPDALRYLARKYGITIQEKELSKEERAAQTDRDSMYIVNEWAKEWFKQQLYETEDGRAIGMAYFRSRGFRDDIITKFQLGYCPNRKGSPMATDALKAGYQQRYLANDPETGVGTGLCFLNQERHELRDRFFGRVMWPIFTVGGKVAGFGGRVLDAATKGVNMKYQNSPESIIYSKKRELFGLFHAKQAIVKTGLCYLVEGYTDVMAMHQSGVENVVASSGTALTNEQIALIHRFTSNIVVIYDGDAAGIKASKRGIDMLLSHGMNVKLMLLPDGDDPDSFSRKHNAEDFQKYLAEHQVDFIKFKTDLVIKEAQGDPMKLSQMVNDIVYSISVISDEITRSLYIREIATMMKMSERLIGDAVNKQVKINHDERIKQWQREKDAAQRRQTMAAQSAQQGLASPGTVNQAPNEATRPAAGGSTVPAAGGSTIPTAGGSTVPAGGSAVPAADGSTIPATGGSTSLAANQPRVDDFPPEYFEQLTGQAPNSPSPILQTTSKSVRLYLCETLLIQAIVRHGEKPLCEVPDADGNPCTLTTSEFIAASLQQDNLQFDTELHTAILNEALEYIGREGWIAEKHFINHPDPKISNLAFELASDKVELSKLHGVRDSARLEEDQLMEHILHILSDFKLAVIEKEKVAIEREMSNPLIMSDKARYMELLKRFKEVKEIENTLAKQCGDRVFMR